MRIDDMLSQYQNNDFPELVGAIDSLINRAELMGYDTTDPELMGGLIKKLVKRIKKRIAAKKKKGGSGGTYSISTPTGTVSVGAGGVQLTRPAGTGTGTTMPLSIQQPGMQQAGIMGMIQEKPYLLAIPALAMALIMAKKKK